MTRRAGRLLVLLVVSQTVAPWLCACRRAPQAERATAPGQPASVQASSSRSSTDQRPLVAFLGTSLTAGLGLSLEEAFPSRIQARIDAAGLRYRVQNAGVSGETSAAARQRLDWLLRQRVAVLVIETGANDGLRGQDPSALKANLEAMVDKARTQDPPPKLLLLGMKAPPNLGADYTKRFAGVYREVATEKKVPLVPFFLDGVAGRPELNQADGIHPTAEGQALIAETVFEALRPLL
jgi:acyl-CoA thioesterase-1